MSGSCSCSSTGAGLRPQVAGRPRPGGHVSVSGGLGATLTHFPLGDWAPYLSGIQDGGGGGIPCQVKLRLVKPRPFELKDGLSSHSGSSRWGGGHSAVLSHTVATKAVSPIHLSQPGKGQGGNKEPPDGPPGRSLPVWGLFLGNDQFWESAPTSPGRSRENPQLAWRKSVGL